MAPHRALGQREGEDPTAQNFVDDEDESDADDVPPAPREAPPGFKIADGPPSAEQLTFSKEKEVPGDALVGISILYNWLVVGWCVGQVVEGIGDLLHLGERDLWRHRGVHTREHEEFPAALLKGVGALFGHVRVEIRAQLGQPGCP